jgi:hypothetical protein
MSLQLSLSLSLRSTARGEPWDMCQRRSPPLRRGVVRSRGMRVSVGALLGGEAGYGAEGLVTASEPQDSVSAGAFLGGEAGSGALGQVTMPEPSLSKDAGSGAAGHVAAHGHMPCSLSARSLYAGYSVYRVLTTSTKGAICWLTKP